MALLRLLTLGLSMIVLGAPVASAHPMSRDKWSLRTAVQLQDTKLEAVVVLEVPFAQVTEDLKADMEKARQAADASAAAQAVLDRYTQSHFKRMADGLTLTLDGKPVPGSWQPRKNRLNGKGAVTGGFFMYIVEFVPSGPLPLDGDVTLVIDNKGYTEHDMVYSAMVLDGEGWKLLKNSAAALLPSTPYDLNAPEFWVEDPALRRLEARFVKP